MLFFVGFAAILFSILSSSCQKAGVNLNSGLPLLDSGSNSTNPPGGGSGSTSGYYITADMDGVAKTFNVSATATTNTLSGITILQIEGFATSVQNLESFGLMITDPTGPVTAGTYSELDNTGIVTQGDYNPGSTTVVWGTGLVSDVSNPLKVTISQIDSKTVTGTFSGDFYYVNTTTAQIGPDKKVFSNGKFYLKF